MTPSNLKYTKSHEWIDDLGNGTVRLGLTDHAQSEMGDIVYVDLPETGDTVTTGETCCEVESVKAVSGVYSPVSGTVKSVNDNLADAPELINTDAYSAWLLEIENVDSLPELMDASAYDAFVQEEN